MKIYTKTGDRGFTSLFGGKRVNKNDLRVEAYGKVDELNCLLGVVTAEGLPKNILKKILRIQNELFILGSDLATPPSVKVNVPRIKKSFTKNLEKEIDEIEKNLPALKNFILPGGSKTASRVHLARSAARCLERILVDLDHQEKLNGEILPYINRLSDWFFVIARHINKIEDCPEIIWQGRK